MSFTQLDDGQWQHDYCRRAWSTLERAQRCPDVGDEFAQAAQDAAASAVTYSQAALLLVEHLYARRARFTDPTPVPNLSAAGSVDLTLDWLPSPWPDLDYIVDARVELDVDVAARVAIAVTGLTVAGCTVTVTSSGPVGHGQAVACATSLSAT